MTKNRAKIATDGINHARFCASSGNCDKKPGTRLLKLDAFKPSKTPKTSATAVTGITINDGRLKNFHKKLRRITTIAGG